jgi:hypothetical protein
METVAGSPTDNNLRGLCRKRGVLTEENIAWLESVFRETAAGSPTYIMINYVACAGNLACRPKINIAWLE